MARLRKEQWEELKADYVTGAYTLEVLAKKYGVSKGAISQRAKKEGWRQLDIKETAELVEIEKVNKTKQTKLNEKSRLVRVEQKCLERAISEIADYQTFIHSLAIKAGERIQELLEENEVEEIVALNGERCEAVIKKRKINPKEIKSVVDAIDRVGQTLGVVPRFNQQVNIQNTQQMNTLKIEVVRPNEDK